MLSPGLGGVRALGAVLKVDEQEEIKVSSLSRATPSFLHL